MNNILTATGVGLLIMVSWISGLLYPPYLIKRLFPDTSWDKQTGVGIAAYLILTGLILVIIGQSL